MMGLPQKATVPRQYLENTPLKREWTDTPVNPLMSTVARPWFHGILPNETWRRPNPSLFPGLARHTRRTALMGR